MNEEIKKILDIANGEIGYLEKASNSDLDDKTANAGSNNYTKYARDMDNLDVYNTPKNGYSWCKIFVDWCFVQALGQERAEELLKGWTAGVTQFYGWNKTNVVSSPEAGDLIIFGDCDHIGIIAGVSGDTITTIEGNTSNAAEMVANGGCVAKKTYNKNSSWIKCFVKPNYEGETVEYTEPTEGTTVNETPLIRKGSKGEAVKKAQELLIEKGYSCGSYGADSDFGSATEQAVKNLQQDAGIEVDGIVGENTWRVLLSDFTKPNKVEYPGYIIEKGQTSENVRKVQERLEELGYDTGNSGADGIFGKDTAEAVKKFQWDNGLSVDAQVGPKTWEKLFN